MSETYYGVVSGDSFINAKANKLSSQDSVTHFVIYGNLDSSWKGSDTAIEVFRNLDPEVKNLTKLHLAAYSKNKPSISDPHIKFYDWLEDAEIPKLLASMDVQIVASRDKSKGVMKETFCQSMVQGMLCGLPIIANDLPVLTEKIDSGGGLVFKGKEELAKHIEKLAKDHKLRERLGGESKQIAKDRYLWNSAEFVEKFLFPAKRDS